MKFTPTYRSDDPALDAERYMMAQEIRLARLPQCHCCEEHIRANAALHYVTRSLDIWLCPDCVEDLTEYIEED